MPDTSPRDADRLARLDALLFDLDGVLTPTAEVHMRAWSRLFTEYFAPRGLAPYTEADYFEHVDGRPRYDGVRAMLAARGVTLPEGSDDDGPDAPTVRGLGNRKNAAFAAELAENGVTPYPGSVAFLDRAIELGVRVAVVSSSRNAVPVLEAAGLRDRFDVIVDGVVAATEGIAGKPAPDTYLEGARRLGLTAADCVVVEDAQSGVEAGRRGAFGLVLGVDRGTGAQALLDFGADVVVDDLGEVVDSLGSSRTSADGPADPPPPGSAPNPRHTTPGSRAPSTDSSTRPTEERS
ncbi:HAD family hydrolase [Frigoribacterium faeni]|uniref:Beta-phosphoglucomutase n=1 Tax=Frigoribacterium faeni TaxID=145483 RepID=A0A7W3JHV2_9MICO|nr:beta-phosphoglucomutase family hydrolase [Frigoribacterium faeni]MBA8813085.1 beta-phosphoglucomutase family hydrolase [Frigoribacterium faeni]GEK84027.1 haloacid dehalogenase [Frigoribacterium faeni]